MRLLEIKSCFSLFLLLLFFLLDKPVTSPTRSSLSPSSIPLCLFFPSGIAPLSPPLSPLLFIPLLLLLILPLHLIPFFPPPLRYSSVCFLSTCFIFSPGSPLPLFFSLLHLLPFFHSPITKQTQCARTNTLKTCYIFLSSRVPHTPLVLQHRFEGGCSVSPTLHSFNRIVQNVHCSVSYSTLNFLLVDL